MFIGAFVDEKYNIFIRKGDSGTVLVKGIPTDDTYKVSLGVVNPETQEIVKEFTSYSSGLSEVSIQFTTQETEDLGEGKFLYGIKITLGDSETTVIPNAYKSAGGCLTIPYPPTFNVLPKLVEG